MNDRAILKQQAKTALGENFGTAFGIFIVYGAIMAGINVIPGIGQIASFILSGVFLVGYAYAFLKLVRCPNELRFSDMFLSFDNFGTNCVAGILVSVFTFLWTLLLIVPGIIKALSYSMTKYILADHPELTAREAINASKRMMDGHKADLFVLGLSFILWDLLVLVTFGIAIFYVGPYQAAAYARFYDLIKDEKLIGY